jgi:hypothetical protein
MSKVATIFNVYKLEPEIDFDVTEMMDAVEEQ